MNIKRLKQAEKHFHALFPAGFADPKMEEIRKKHKPEKMYTLVRNLFAPDCFNQPQLVLENMVKVISRSSLVSVFEKPKFRDLAKGLDEGEAEQVSEGLYHFLHGDQERGFGLLTETLLRYKLAKWTLITVIPAYYYPEKEVFIKPTTVKRGIRFFELTGLEYKPRPSFLFYTRYRDALEEMKRIVPVTRDNIAFGGFIMITTPEL